MSSIQHILQKLRDEIIDFNRKDVLVHIDSGNKKLVFQPDFSEIELNSTVKRILSATQENLKSAGFNSLCWARGVAKFQFKNQEIQSPIFLFPTEFKQNRISKTVTFDRNEIGILNPFLVELFKDELGDWKSLNEIDWNEIDNISSKLNQLPIELDLDFECLGNFHHHRYSTLRELEELIETNDYSSSLLEIIEEKNTKDFPFNWSKNLLLPADSDHRKVLDSAERENIVVHGPPGTGKSQVLVNLIGKAIENEQKIALVSEKFSALEVVQKRLQQVGLSDFSFIATQRGDRKKFIQSLKSNWEQLSNTELTPPKPLLRISEQSVNQLDFSIELLRKKDIVGGISIREFQKKSGKIDLKKEFISWAPKISEFLENESKIQKIYEEKLSILGKIHPMILKSDELLTLSERIERIKNLTKELQSIFDIQSIRDVHLRTKQSADLQLFEGELYRKYGTVFHPNSKEQKKYLRLKKKWKSLQEKLEDNSSDWKNQPNEIECDSLISNLENGNFFQKRKAKNRWKEISNLDVQFASERLKSWKNQLEIQQEIKKNERQFSEINVQNPAEEISIIDGAIHFFTEEKFQLFDQLSGEEKSKIGKSHRQFEDLNSLLKSNFVFGESEDFQTILNYVSERLSSIILHQSEFKNWSTELFKIIAQIDSFEECRKTIFRSHWIQFSNRFTQFSIKSDEELKKSLNEILLLERNEQADFAQSIQFQIQQKFNEFTELLSIPAQKLSQEKKELKKRLRKGKSILVKEFNKTRNHPSIRTLFSSEAREWIQLLKPFFLCNPSQMADAFPLEKELFDVVLFDEASQMILQDSLGSIQRAKRIVVCGDEQQMQPTNYFSAENSAVDLLHQANFYLKKVPLTHHYRSQNPKLIEFSNKHFYNNQLKAFPSSDKSAGIEWKKIDGIYADGINEIEAQEVAKFIEAKIDSKIDLGIVAFSEKQLDCIWKKLSIECQEKIELKVDKGAAFFKTLENVQGDECDEIIISFGYGKDSEGNFAMRFGPMNLETGRNRLNVLLTRARKKIIFVSSVSAEDFKISNNESIEILRKWFVHLENQTDNSENEVIDLTPERFDSSRDLITYYSVVKI